MYFAKEKWELLFTFNFGRKHSK